MLKGSRVHACRMSMEMNVSMALVAIVCLCAGQMGVGHALAYEEDVRWMAKHVSADDNLNCVPDNCETKASMAVRLIRVEGVPTGLTPTRAVVHPRTVRVGERVAIYVNTSFDTTETEVRILSNRHTEIARVTLSPQCRYLLGAGWNVTAAKGPLIVRIGTPVDTLEARVKVTE